MDDRENVVEMIRVDGVIRWIDVGQIHVDTDNGVAWSPGVPTGGISRLGLKPGDRVVIRTTMEVVRPEPAREAPGEIDGRFAKAIAAAFGVHRAEPCVARPVEVTPPTIVTVNSVGPEPPASPEPEGRKINFREWT